MLPYFASFASMDFTFRASTRVQTNVLKRALQGSMLTRKEGAANLASIRACSAFLASAAFPARLAYCI